MLARYRGIIIVLCTLLILGAATALYFFDPMESVWMPKCTFYMITGYKCPSCGLMRSIHALIHGQLYEAWTQNPMAIITIPLAAIIIWRSLREDKPTSDTTRRWVYAYIFVFLSWWVIRNIIHI